MCSGTHLNVRSDAPCLVCFKMVERIGRVSRLNRLPTGQRRAVTRAPCPCTCVLSRLCVFRFAGAVVAPRSRKSPAMRDARMWRLAVSPQRRAARRRSALRPGVASRATLGGARARAIATPSDLSVPNRNSGFAGTPTKSLASVGPGTTSPVLCSSNRSGKRIGEARLSSVAFTGGVSQTCPLHCKNIG